MGALEANGICSEGIFMQANSLATFWSDVQFLREIRQKGLVPVRCTISLNRRISEMIARFAASGSNITQTQ